MELTPGFVLILAAIVGMTIVGGIKAWRRPLKTKAKPDDRLLEAAETVLEHLQDRIRRAPPDAVPVFEGIADLHVEVARARGRID